MWTDKAVYDPGQTAQIHVAAAAGIRRAYLNVYRGATGVLSTAVDLEAGHADVALPIGTELGGLLVVDALADTADGDAVHVAEPLLVHRDDGLQVSLTADHDSYAPGDEAQVSVQVTDSSGAPRVASVGLNVVDEAVFALGGEPHTSITQAFGLDGNVLPASLSVAGHGPSDLLSTSDPAAREQLARVLFASAPDVHAPSFDYDSLAEELPRS